MPTPWNKHYFFAVYQEYIYILFANQKHYAE